MPHCIPRSVILVHGAWHGSWSWSAVADRLRRAGVDVTVVDLAGRGRGPGDPTLSGHADSVADLVTRIGRPTVLCGHSYGGAVISQAPIPASADVRLVYVAAFMPDRGEACLPAPDPAGGADSVFSWDGDFVSVPDQVARELFYNGMPDDAVRDATAQLVPEHRDAIYAPVADAAWRRLPSAYVLCTDDRAIASEAQTAMAERAGSRYVLAAGHSPMLTHPDDLAAILTAEALRRD